MTTRNVKQLPQAAGQTVRAGKNVRKRAEEVAATLAAAQERLEDVQMAHDAEMRDFEIGVRATRAHLDESFEAEVADIANEADALVEETGQLAGFIEEPPASVPIVADALPVTDSAALTPAPPVESPEEMEARITAEVEARHFAEELAAREAEAQRLAQVRLDAEAAARQVVVDEPAPAPVQAPVMVPVVAPEAPADAGIDIVVNPTSTTRASRATAQVVSQVKGWSTLIKAFAIVGGIFGFFVGLNTYEAANGPLTDGWAVLFNITWVVALTCLGFFLTGLALSWLLGPDRVETTTATTSSQ